jgi:hypothetical protein
MKKNLFLCSILAFLLTTGCHTDDQPTGLHGDLTISYKRADHSIGGRTTDQAIPAFVSYTLKKADGSVVSEKIELFEFNGDFISGPQQLETGHYTLEQFLVLDAANQTIYASPLLESELADLVDHPLPLPFEVAVDEVTNLVPEVLAVADHSPEEFGYVQFGFEVVEKFDFDVTATIADDDQHPVIDYSLEIIAKDAPLGNVLWMRTVAMSASGEIRIPAKYNHYTLKAIKPGHVSHVQHFMAEDLSQSVRLDFEFLPEDLSNFHVNEKDGIKVYTSKDRCKDYARMDVPEGYQLTYAMATRTAISVGGYPLDGGARWRECGEPNPDQEEVLLPCRNSINLFDNVPFGLANDHCALVDLTLSPTTDTMDQVVFLSNIEVGYQIPASDISFSKVFYTHWNQGDSQVF